MVLNESQLIEKEITIRNLRLTSEVLETRRSLIRWMALSLGIINPGESRLSSIAVLDALVHYNFIVRQEPGIEELKEYINKNWEEINEKTLRYHLLRMKRMGFVENSKGKFYLRPPNLGDRHDPSNWVNSVLEAEYKEVAAKVSEAIKEIAGRNK